MRRLQLAVLATAMQLAQGWSESLLNNINDVWFLSLSLSLYIYICCLGSCQHAQTFVPYTDRLQSICRCLKSADSKGWSCLRN